MKINWEKARSLNVREKTIIAATVIGMAGYLMYIFLIAPALSNYRIARKEYLSQISLLNKRKVKSEDLSRVKEEFSGLQDEFTGRKAVFFNEREVTEFLDDLERKASETNNDLKAIRPLGTEPLHVYRFEDDIAVAYKKDTVSIIVEGKYNSLLRYFREIDTPDKLLRISEVEIRSIADNSLELEAKFNLNLYYIIDNIQGILQQ